MPEELDREHRLRDEKGNFKIFGEARKDHPYNRKNGRPGTFNEKTGAVEYADPKPPSFRFETK
jgi:hypothetical protein